MLEDMAMPAGSVLAALAVSLEEALAEACAMRGKDRNTAATARTDGCLLAVALAFAPRSVRAEVPAEAVLGAASPGTALGRTPRRVETHGQATVEE